MTNISSLQSYFLGIAMIIITLWALRKNVGIEKYIIILSPIFTYPFFLFYLPLRLLALGANRMWIFYLSWILFFILYCYLLYHFHDWVEVKKRNILFATFTLLIAVSIIIYLVTVPIDHFCWGISNAEENVSIEDIAYCKSLGFYNSNAFGERSFTFAAIGLMMLGGPWLIYLFQSINYLRSLYQKNRISSFPN